MTFPSPVIDRKARSLRVHVVLTPEAEWTDTSSDVLAGHERVAAAIVEAWLADNPHQVMAAFDVWMAENHASDVADLDWAKRWAAELSAAPGISDALKHGAEELFERAGLTKFQAMAMRKLAAGNTPKQIAFSVGITPDSARERIRDARQKILSLRLGDDSE